MRNSALKLKRDRRMIDKFHELYNVKRFRMDDVLKQLSEEHFFLAPDYIYNRIFYDKENNEYYNNLLRDNQK